MYRRFTIQPSEVHKYHREGYLLKKRFIQESLLQQAVAAGKQLVQQEPSVDKGDGHVRITGDALSKAPEFAALLESPTLWKAAAALLGSRNLVHHFFRLTIKIPGQEGIICWHRDSGHRYISPAASDFLRVFIPLTAFNDSSGAQTIVHKSNHMIDRPVKLPEPLNGSSIKKFPLPKHLCCCPGDVIFIHPKTRHYSVQSSTGSPCIHVMTQAGVVKRAVNLKINRTL